MSMRRSIVDEGRIYISPDALGEKLQERVTITADISGILLVPYGPGDEEKPDRKVVSWDHYKRIRNPAQYLQKAGLKVGDAVDLLCRADSAIVIVPAKDTCTLCGRPSEHMVEMPNGRLVCEKCRAYLRDK